MLRKLSCALALHGLLILIIGPPGTVKMLLARAKLGILPLLTIGDALDAIRFYSVADQLPLDVPLFLNRPLRAPNNTISHADLVGDDS